MEQRIAVIDGAMGTTIRTYGMAEKDIRGERFANAEKDLLNNGDLFSITQPKMIERYSPAVPGGWARTSWRRIRLGRRALRRASSLWMIRGRRVGGKDPEFYQKIH